MPHVMSEPTSKTLSNVPSSPTRVVWEISPNRSPGEETEFYYLPQAPEGPLSLRSRPGVVFISPSGTAIYDCHRIPGLNRVYVGLGAGVSKPQTNEFAIWEESPRLPIGGWCYRANLPMEAKGAALLTTNYDVLVREILTNQTENTAEYPSSQPDISYIQAFISLPLHIQQRLDSFRDLGEDWDTYGAHPIPEQAIDYAKSLLLGIYQQRWFGTLRPFISALPEGGVEIEWGPFGGRSLILYVHTPDEPIEYLLSIDEEEIEGETRNILQIFGLLDYLR